MTTLGIPTPARAPREATAPALLADVALPLPLDRTFAYRIPEALRGVVRRGCRVAVPFGSRSLVGFVVGFDPSDAPADLKPIQRVLDPEPLLDDELLDLARWLAERTLCSVGEAIRAVLPGHPAPRRERVVSLAGNPAIDLFGASDDARLEDRIVSLVAENEELTVAAIAKALGLRAADGEPALQSLARSKRVRWVERAESGGVSQAPRQKIVRMTAAGDAPAAADRARAPVQARCLEYLRDAGGAMPLRELAAAVAGGRAALARLAERGVVRITSEEWEGHRETPVIAAPEIELNGAQAAAVATLEAALESAAAGGGEGASDGAAPRARVFLLHGVTGSGKTEVYLRAMRAVHRLGRQTIFLVPEITLTPQTVSKLRGRFGGRAAVLHSRLTDAERRRIWHGARRGDYAVVLGPRSAIFAPLPRLGLVVVDEEHEGAYKQEDAPRYLARDVAVERARRTGAVVVLGSATPDLETFARCEAGEFTRIRLPERVSKLPMPSVRLVDLRGATGQFSPELLEGIAARLERGEQVILFLNRRGFSPFVQCVACGEAIRCVACAVSLTFHKADRTLRCHYCDESRPVPERCPACSAKNLVFRGAGTQRIEEELRERFPGIRLARLDSDSVRPRGEHERILGEFLEGSIDVLLGTQMVAKGLDFPRVTLVGVINGDHGLHLPDYRAAERTFQLLTQVAGRAGRSELGGEVVVQTRCPEHVCFLAAAAHDDEAFRAREIPERRAMRYPPFARIASVLVRGPDLVQVEEAARLVRDRIAERIATSPEWAEVLGPAPAPLAQLRGKHRQRILVKASRREDLVAAVLPARQSLPGRTDVEVVVDVDPLDML